MALAQFSNPFQEWKNDMPTGASTQHNNASSSSLNV